MTSFAMLPPEVNSLRMFTGAGSAPMLNAATAWDSMASELGVAASSFSSVTSGLAGDVWQGAASAAMTAAASSYAKLLGAASTRAAAAATQAKAVAGVFEDARAAMVHPLAVAANRSAFLKLVQSNWLGLNAPAIMATEGHYEQMWA
ncbi:PPE family protein, partial [Mycobacterium marinum]